MTIAICSSAAFYRHVIELKVELEHMGHAVWVPHNALEMQKNDDYDVEHYKTWYADEGDYHKKSDLMRRHFAEIAKSQAILVVNDEKHGVPNYIGGNVLMEMAVAFYLQKQIYIWGELPKNSPFEEEYNGMQPILLHGNLKNLTH